MKTKKIISIILAIVMLTSCFTTAFSVFAADDAATLISGFNGNMTVAEPSAEDLAAYNSMVSAFNALTQDEINEFDVFLFDKLLLAVYDREMALWKKENNSTSTANAYKAVHARAEGVITMPSYVSDAAALYIQADAIKTQQQADAFIATLKDASVNAIILAGGYYKSYKAFRYSASEKYGVELIDLAADRISAITQKTETAPSSPKSVSKPSASKFPEGANDPGYIAAYQAYLQYKEAQADYYVAKYEFEIERHYLSAMKKLTEAAPYFSFVYDICKYSIEAKRNFNANSDTAKIADVLAIYNTLTPAQKTWFDGTDGYAMAEKTVKTEDSLGIEYTYKIVKFSELIDFCVSMEFFYMIKNFEDTVNAVSEPYTNAHIAAVKAAYNEIPESILGSVNAEVLAKYKEILASVGPDESVDNQPDLDSYIETDTSFAGISEKDAQLVADTIIDLALDAVGAENFKALVDTKLLSNSMVATLAGVVYPLLNREANGLLNMVPTSLVPLLTEEKFAGAVEALNAAGEDWSALTVKSGDFGFEDGDVEGFLDGASAMLRGASLLHVALTLENQADTKNGVYTYGAYEELIETFELLDLDAVMSSVEYTEYVNNAQIKNDAKFRAILAPIAYLFAELGNDPVNTICDILPKFAYVIDTGIANANVNKVISMFQVISVDPVDLTTAGVYKLLNENLLAPMNIALTEEEFSTLIKDLSGCGTAVVKESVRRGMSYRMGIESDKSKTIVVLISWLLDVAANNKEVVNTLLDMLVPGNDLLKLALKALITVSSRLIPRKVIFIIVTVIVSIANALESLGISF